MQKNIIKDLINKGYGRRRIAQYFNITEWGARQLIDEVLEEESEQARNKKKKQKGKPSIKRGKPEAKQKKTSGKPTINVKSSRIFGKNHAIDADRKASITKRNTSYKIAVLSDIHFPYEDQNALKLALAVIKDQNPDMIILNGDIADCYAVSRYSKSPLRKKTIQDEFDYTHQELSKIRDMFPDTEIKYLEGNHETRVKRFLDTQAPELASVRALSIEESLGLKELGIEFLEEAQDLEVGRLTFMHGTKVRKHAGNSARGHFEDIGCSVCIGHVHRLSVAWKRNKYGSHVMIENGTLCDFDVEYARFPDWQQGFSMIYFDGEDLNVAQYPITNYKIITKDKVYTI